MISFPATPARLKALLAGGGLVLLCLSLAAGAALYYRGALHTEQASHKTTRSDYAGRLAMAETANNLLAEENSALSSTVKGLQEQVRGLSDSLERERNAAAGRAAIISRAASVPAAQEKVVDRETSRKIIQHLNTALQR